MHHFWHNKLGWFNQQSTLLPTLCLHTRHCCLSCFVVIWRVCAHYRVASASLSVESSSEHHQREVSNAAVGQRRHHTSESRLFDHTKTHEVTYDVFYMPLTCHLASDVWHVNCGIWHVIFHLFFIHVLWCVICDVWCVMFKQRAMCDLWCMTCDLCDWLMCDLCGSWRVKAFMNPSLFIGASWSRTNSLCWWFCSLGTELCVCRITELRDFGSRIFHW